tara:strand:- start:1006 stop:1827 length:822 start_codon:yes stop_codon:yes gene_type:complete
MSELEKFMGQQTNKSALTQKQYRLQYNKLHKLLDKDISDSSEEFIIKTIDDITNGNTVAALLNIAIMVRRMEQLGVDKLIKRRDKIKDKIIENRREKNVILDASLPTYDDLIEYMEHLYTTKKYEDFIINYLLIFINTRNQDLSFKIVSKNADAKDKQFNYLIVSHAGKITFVRNNYKTADTYGTKTNSIEDDKFKVAARAMKKEYLNDFMIKPEDIQYKVRKATLEKIGEGNYNKIIVNHFREDFNKLATISKNRGTDLETIKEYYDIKDHN